MNRDRDQIAWDQANDENRRVLNRMRHVDDTGHVLAKPEKLTFVIYWLDNAGFPGELPRPRIIGRDEVKRYDLTDAITAACNMLKSGRGNSDFAKGFTVKAKREVAE